MWRRADGCCSNTLRASFWSVGVDAELRRRHEPPELVRIVVGERGELGARRAALVGGEPG
jgi:hypothetical protein